MLPNRFERSRTRKTGRDRQKEETRQRVYEAAKELFREKGYLRTRTADIAERAGVSHGAVHAHFQSKANILSVLMLEYFGEVDARMRAAPLRASDPVERVKETVLQLADIHLANFDQVSWYFGYSWIWEAEEERAYRSHQDRIDSKMTGVIRDGVAEGRLRAETPIEMIVGVLRGYFMTQLRRRRFEAEAPEAFADRVGTCVDLLLGPYRA
jgi:AcrR family transcriptional regulator